MKNDFGIYGLIASASTIIRKETKFMDKRKLTPKLGGKLLDLVKNDHCHDDVVVHLKQFNRENRTYLKRR